MFIYPAKNCSYNKNALKPFCLRWIFGKLLKLSNKWTYKKLSKLLCDERRFLFQKFLNPIFILKYLEDEKMRRKIQKQLNRGEQRHGLAKWLFFANHGEFRTGDYEEIMNKVSCLSILSNAALIWNTVEIHKLIEQLRLSGEEIKDEHIGVLGTSP